MPFAVMQLGTVVPGVVARSAADDHRQGGAPAGGGRGFRRERRGSTTERRAEGLVVAPAAQPALVVPEVTGGHGALDRGPDRLERALEAEQFSLVGGVGERVAVLEV